MSVDHLKCLFDPWVFDFYSPGKSSSEVDGQTRRDQEALPSESKSQDRVRDGHQLSRPKCGKRPSVSTFVHQLYIRASIVHSCISCTFVHQFALIMVHSSRVPKDSTKRPSIIKEKQPDKDETAQREKGLGFHKISKPIPKRFLPRKSLQDVNY